MYTHRYTYIYIHIYILRTSETFAFDLNVLHPSWQLQRVLHEDALVGPVEVADSDVDLHPRILNHISH